MSSNKQKHNFLTADSGSIWCFNPKNHKINCLIVREENTFASQTRMGLFSINSNKNIVMKLGIRKASRNFAFEKVLWANDLNEHKFGWIPECDAVDYLEPFFLKEKQ